MAIDDTTTVPATSGRTPKRLLANSGVHSVPVRNSMIETSCRKPNVSTASTRTMPAVVNTERAAQRNSSLSMNHSLQRLLAFFGKHLLDGQPDLRAAFAKQRPGTPRFEMLGDKSVTFATELDIADFFGQLAGIGDVIVHEALHLRPCQRLLRHIDEQGARQRLIRPGSNRVQTRDDWAFTVLSLAVVDRHQLEALLILRVVSKRQEADREFVTADALNQDVVVLARRKVAAARAFLADDRFGEVVV